MADKTEFLQAIDDAILDADSLEQFINGSDSETVLTRLSAEYPTLQKALKELFENGGIADRFKTLADLQASSLVDGDYALVADDSDTKNGVYIKEGGEWVKSKYDVVSQLEKTVRTNDTNQSDIAILLDADGAIIYRATTDAKHYFVGIENDLKSELDEAKQKELVKNLGRNIFEIEDSNGRVTLSQDAYGNLHLPQVGNLTERLLNTSASSPADETALLAAHKAGEYADNLLLESTELFEKTDILLTVEQVRGWGIFTQEVNFLRIPAITRIAKNKYVLFFEVRIENTSDIYETSSGSVIVTIDMETYEPTLSDPAVIHEAGFEDGLDRIFMNPCGVYLGNDRLICMYVRRNYPDHHNLYMRESIDGGKTWSDFTDISSIYKTEPYNYNMVLACSQGLVKRFGKHKGRIVFPVWHNGQNYNYNDFRSGFIYSDDKGETWHMGDFCEQVPTGNEVQCCEDLNGDLVFAIRTAYNNNPKVMARYSFNDNEYRIINTDHFFTAETIMGGLIQGDNEFDKTNGKMQMTVCRDNNRIGMLIHTSYDGGKTWTTHDLQSVTSERVMYTCIENLTARLKFMLWESVALESFKYSVISLKNLVGE